MTFVDSRLLSVRGSIVNPCVSRLDTLILRTGKPQDDNFYYMPVGLRRKYDASRRFEEIPVRLPHEVLAEEFRSSATIKDSLTAALEDETLPKAYHEHEFVRASPGEPVYPVCLYIDGASFSRTDSVFVF